MILVDSRVGSKGLYPYFPKGRARLLSLDYADFAIDTDMWLVGVERKTIGDFVSSMESGRLCDHQIPGMAESYEDFYILLEGTVKKDKYGEATIRGRNVRGDMSTPYNKVVNMITTITTKAHIKVIQSLTPQDTVDRLLALEDWWHNYDNHHSHQRTYDDMMFSRTSIKHKIAARLPGIGHKRASTVDSKFNSIYGMITAHQKEWESIEGIGRKTAEKVITTIRQEDT